MRLHETDGACVARRAGGRDDVDVERIGLVEKRPSHIAILPSVEAAAQDEHSNGQGRVRTLQRSARDAAPRRGGHEDPGRDGCVAIVGAGYVGLALAAYLVTTGRSVLLVEADPERRTALARGEIPIYEAGLDSVLAPAMREATLVVTGDLGRALDATRMVFVAVGTPSAADDNPDLSAVTSVVSELRTHAKPGTVVVLKSTVPPGTGRSIQEQLQGPPFLLPVVSCPEFLREGSALRDMYSAARHVIGGDDEEAMARVARVIGHPEIPVVMTDPTSAELIKYGSNSFLALKISFANELARFADQIGADIVSVVRGMGLDPRIGTEGIRAGLGFGGCCLPKDVRALIGAGERHHTAFGTLEAALQVNDTQRAFFTEKIRHALGGRLNGQKVAVLGLAFKPGTDDMREAPSLDIIRHLLGHGAELTAHDPHAISKAAPLLPPQVELTPDPYDCLSGADAAAIVTEWPEYLQLDWNRARQVMRQPVLVDGRNCLDPGEAARLGFRYHAVGRPSAQADRGTRQTETITPAQMASGSRGKC
jgi:UDPglucose 6-dehydrogenase